MIVHMPGSYSEWMLVLRLSRQSLPLVITWLNLTHRCSSISDEKLSLCLERFLWSLVCLCSCVSAPLLSWSLFLRFLNLSSFSAAVSAARWARSLSLLRWSFISLAAEDSILSQRCVRATCVVIKLCHYACALIEKYWIYIVEIEDIYIRYGRTYSRYIYIHIRKISIGITCVGLASARPNKKPPSRLGKFLNIGWETNN